MRIKATTNTSANVASVKKNLQLDWTKKEDARAAIRLAVKRELRGVVEFSDLDKDIRVDD
ncbi:MAG: type I restriction enzyme endonuclease domain-containing protein [Ignavibacteria bacterium]